MPKIVVVGVTSMSNYLLKWVIGWNSISIPLSLILVPFIFDSINNVYDTSTWTEEWQKAVKESNSRWATIMYIVPILGSNIVLILIIISYGHGKATIEKTKDYSEYTEEWREFLRRKDMTNNQNKIDSAEIIKKYNSMPDLSKSKV